MKHTEEQIIKITKQIKACIEKKYDIKLNHSYNIQNLEILEW